MGMSTSVTGFKPPDDRWKALKEVWDSCERAGVEPPPAVRAFFGDVKPDPAGVVVSLKEAVTPYKTEWDEGLQVDLTKVPKDVHYIRFVNSW